MTTEQQSDNIIQAVKLGIITQREAVDLLIAIRKNDQKAIERLRKEHKEIE